MSDKLPQIFVSLTIEVKCPHCGYEHADNEILKGNDKDISDILDGNGNGWYRDKHEFNCVSCDKRFKGEII
jgi:DNA-directed RNA polymerase subunit RPC12/RpoP